MPYDDARYGCEITWERNCLTGVSYLRDNHGISYKGDMGNMLYFNEGKDMTVTVWGQTGECGNLKLDPSDCLQTGSPEKFFAQ